jgi:hypothetical protein
MAGSWTILGNCGRAAIGVALVVMGGGRIISALLAGRTALFTSTASFAGQPILFVAMLAVWTLILACGFSYLVNGVTALRQNFRGAVQ